MSKGLRIITMVLGGFVVISFLHLWLNIGVEKLSWLSTDVRQETFKVGFLPVTCHLTCPVTDWINTNTTGKGFYEPVRFSGWPEIKESIVSGHLPATFLLAPLAMVLRQQGVPIKIVYLGHRDGTAIMVHKDSKIRNFNDLRGKTLAVPNRFSNQYLIVYKGLRDQGMTTADIKIVEMPPPDMPAALFSKSVDAITSGEPFMGQTEIEGYGRVLYQAKQLWPNFISCVLVIQEKMIREHPEQVQRMVDGIAKSGQWLDTSQENRMDAAEVVAKKYYNQNPKLLRYVLSQPPDRVTYTNLSLAKKDFEQIEGLAREVGILKAPIAFEEYADPRFSEKAQTVSLNKKGGQ
ncbi:MAG: ABC transporter substrate-binding protein [Acidobacteriota bacterium]